MEFQDACKFRNVLEKSLNSSSRKLLKGSIGRTNNGVRIRALRRFVQDFVCVR